MPAPHFHFERLREQLQHEIGTVIAREMRDPRIPPVVTITQVKLAHDTRNATVYVSMYGGGAEKAGAVEALNAAAGYIQRKVASRITVKNFPRLYFKEDDSIERGQHINEILKEIRHDLQ